MEFIVLIAYTNKFIQAGSEHLTFIWVHLKLDIEGHFLLDFIDTLMEMLDHALKVEFVGSSYSLYCFFGLEDVPL